MPGSSQHQSNFLGGEWSSTALGRVDTPEYRTALQRCVNALPVEEGAWLRRRGTQRLGPSYLRGQTKLRLFQSSSACPFACEFTDSNLRLWSGDQLVFTNDARTVSSATQSAGGIYLTLDANSGWAIGDQVMLNVDSLDPTLEGGCRGRLMKVAYAATTSLNLVADNGAPMPLPLWPANTLVGAKVLRVLRIGTPYTAALGLDNIRVIQAENQAVIVHPSVAPQLFTITSPTGSNDPTFSLGAVSFVDGPYLDMQGTVDAPETGTVSGYSGSITFTPSVTQFAATNSEVGRLIRLFTEPAAWNSGTSYSAGTNVKYNGTYWTATNTGAFVGLNTNVPPGSYYYTAAGNSAVFWVPALQAASWAYGVITANTTTAATVTLTTNLLSANGTTVTQWQLGTFKAGQYPSCGIYYEGRLFLGGAIKNHFDASMSNDMFTYSPSDPYNNVFDNHACSATLNAKTLENFNWMELDHAGILMGTESGEWLISASTTEDPITPSTIQAKQTTKYGSKLNTEPRRCGMALVFIHRYGRRLYEYLADAFSGKYSGKQLNERAKHMTTNGLVEMAYQEENNPVIWARDAVGGWIGCTYRRVSRFVTEAPVFFGWHRQNHGSTGTIESILSVPAENGTSDRLYMVVVEPNGDRFIEILRQMPDPEVSDE